MPTITISRQFGAGGLTLGKMLAKRFGYKLVDREIVDEIAKRAKVSSRYVEVVEKEAGDFLKELISEIAAGSFGFVSAHARERWTDLDTDDYIRFVKKTITEVGKQGNTVIIGRGSQFIIPSEKDVIKVLLVAEMNHRIEFMMKNYNLTRPQAEKWVRKEEKRRTDFLKLFNSRDPENPHLYNIVLNTSLVTIEEAEDVLARLIESAISKK